MTNSAAFEKSQLREKIVEHLFVGELLRRLWLKGIFDVEVLRSEYDAFGYDLVLIRGDITRHAQLKANSAKRIQVSRTLATKNGGCIILINVDSSSFEIGPYLWFGSPPGDPFPSIAEFKPSKRNTRKKDQARPERKNHVDVPRSKFHKIESIGDLLEILLGPLT